MMEGHKKGDKCLHEECRYLRSHRLALKCFTCKTGNLHATESDWSEYPFGHGVGGPVYFETVCDECGEVKRDSGMAERNKT